MDFLTNLSQGFGVAFSPWNLLFCAIGSVIGTAIGVLPGLGPPATVALLLPITYKMDPASAIIMLAGIFYGAMYGGSTTSILLNIPGEAASVVTCLDGYKMARQGRAGPALGISAIGSFIAGTVSVFGMSLVAPSLASFALKFGPPEYFSLVLLGLMMAVYLSEESIIKGLAMAALGLLLGTVGIDPVHGATRFTFGLSRLLDGFDFVVVAMGLFGISEVLINLEAPEIRDIFKTSFKGILPTREDWRRCWASVARGSFLGFFIGVLPGGGAIISSFISYADRKKGFQASGGIRQRGHRRRSRSGVSEQRGLHLLLHSPSHSGDSGKCDDRDDFCRPHDPWNSTRPLAPPGVSEPFLGSHCFHVYRQCHAFRTESASDRHVGSLA